MNQDLPEGWAKARLDDLFTPRSERVSPNDFPDWPYIGMEHVEPHTNRLLGSVLANTMSSSAARFYSGDVLYGRMRPYLNKVALTSFDGLASAEFIVFPAVAGMSNSFLLWRLSSCDFVEFACNQYEGDRPRVKFDQLGKFELLVPPAAEQIRIVEKLEELLSDLDAGVTELKAAQRKLAQYRQSLLKAAVEGALTADWRAARTRSSEPQETGTDLLQRILTERRARWEANQLAKYAEQGKTPPKGWQVKYPEPVAPETTGLSALPEGWIWASIDQLSLVVRGASPRPAGDPRFFGGNIPWITVGSLTADEGMYLDKVNQFVTPAGKDASRYIQPDTLLLTNSGATLGVPKITRIDGCINDGSVALLEIDEPLKVYLYWFLLTQTKRLRALNQGAAQPNLNTAIVRKICVPICGAAEMGQINMLLDQTVDSIRVQGGYIERGLMQAAAQHKNILKAAFTGQLVPQNFNDEPASALLERIRTERTNLTGTAKPRGRKPRTTA